MHINVSHRDAWGNVTFRLKLSEKMCLHGQRTLSNISKVEHARKSIFECPHLYQMQARKRKIAMLSR